MLEEGLLSEAQIKDIDASVTEVVEEAVKFADESPKPVRRLPPRASMWTHFVAFV